MDQRFVRNPITYEFLGDRTIAVPTDLAVLREYTRRRAHAATTAGQLDDRVVQDMAVMWDLLDQLDQLGQLEAAPPLRKRRVGRPGVVGDVPAWRRVLETVAEQGDMSAADIAEVTGMPMSSVWARTTELVRARWLERFPASDVGRVQYRLTVDGKEQLDNTR